MSITPSTKKWQKTQNLYPWTVHNLNLEPGYLIIEPETWILTLGTEIWNNDLESKYLISETGAWNLKFINGILKLESGYLTLEQGF